MKAESQRNNASSVLAVTDRDHIAGPENAPLTIVEYGDFQCRYCGEAHMVINELQSRLGSRLRFVFRHFPLASIHPHAAHAAEAAEAAAAQGKFWEMHDLLFENQNDLRDEAIAAYAASLGIDTGRLMSEVANGAHSARVREDFRSGARSGVNGTPTLFINGVRYDGSLDLASLLATSRVSVPSEG